MGSLEKVKAGKHNNIYHKDNEYRWGGITTVGQGYPHKEGDYYDDWNGWVEESNSQILCGYQDCGFPTVKN